MAYAVVQDVPATWEQYEPLGAALRRQLPEGLIFHVAGPTDEGYRTIDVWESRGAWERFRRQASGSSQPEPAWAAPALRELLAVVALAGTPLSHAGVDAPGQPKEADDA